jgi:hypothetical protein
MFNAHPRHILSNDNVDARSMATRVKEERDMGALRVPDDGLSSQE